MFEKILVVIPARGGSKEVPRKNMQPLGGYPLFVHSIRHALSASIPPSNILVSSDDEEILETARPYEVICHRRPDAISGDLSSTEDCLVDAWEQRQDCDTVLSLQPTSPIRFSVKAFLNFYLDGDYDSALTVTKLYNFFWRERPVCPETTSYYWSASYDLKNRMMRQEVGREDFRYFDCGNMYMSNAKMLMKNRCRLGEEVGIFRISDIEGMQIDTHTDLDIFRQLAKGWKFS